MDKYTTAQLVFLILNLAHIQSESVISHKISVNSDQVSQDFLDASIREKFDFRFDLNKDKNFSRYFFDVMTEKNVSPIKISEIMVNSNVFVIMQTEHVDLIPKGERVTQTDTLDDSTTKSLETSWFGYKQQAYSISRTLDYSLQINSEDVLNYCKVNR